MQERPGARRSRPAGDRARPPAKRGARPSPAGLLRRCGAAGLHFLRSRCGSRRAATLWLLAAVAAAATVVAARHLRGDPPSPPSGSLADAERLAARVAELELHRYDPRVVRLAVRMAVQPGDAAAHAGELPSGEDSAAILAGVRGLIWQVGAPPGVALLDGEAHYMLVHFMSVPWLGVRRKRATRSTPPQGTLLQICTQWAAA